MKSVLISIQPRWCELIASGKKTIEIRKSKPKLDVPFKVYIYMTAGDAVYPVSINGAPYTCSNVGGKVVIGEFVCDKIENIEIRHFTVFGHENLYTAVGENPDNQWLKHSCLSYDEIVRYGKHAPLYGWHISDLVIYDKPRELGEFMVFESKACPAYLNGVCFYRTQNHVIRCKNLDCEHKKITRPPQSWCYVERR